MARNRKTAKLSSSASLKKTDYGAKPESVGDVTVNTLLWRKLAPYTPNNGYYMAFKQRP